MLRLKLLTTKLPLIMLLLAAGLTMLRFDRPLVRGDGIAYMAWLDTLVLDQDVDFSNQWDRFEPVNTYHIAWNGNTARWVNIFPFGAAILHAPFYAAGHVAAKNGWFDANPDYFAQMQGVGRPYSLAVMFGANLMTLVTVGLAYQLSRDLMGRDNGWLVALMVYAFLVGTPLLYYSTVEPLNSHSTGAFAMTSCLYLFLRSMGFNRQIDPAPSDADVPDSGHWSVVRDIRWVMVGVFAGLTVLTRWQLALAVVPAWLLLAYRRKWRAFWISGPAAAASILPLPLIWKELFGKYITIPFNEVNDQTFLNTSNDWWNVLVTNTMHSPLTIFALVGLIVLFLRRRYEWTLFFGSIVAGQLYINGAALDWNAGYSYGMRRMTEIFLVYVTLAAVTMRVWLDYWSLRDRLLRRLRYLPYAGFLLAAGYSLIFMLAFLAYIWTSPDGWLGKLTPQSVIPYFVELSNREEIVDTIFTTHLGPPAWPMPGP